jgi:hypothetical protein
MKFVKLLSSLLSDMCFESFCDLPTTRCLKQVHLWMYVHDNFSRYFHLPNMLQNFSEVFLGLCIC